MKQIIVLLIILMMLLTGCNTPTGNTVAEFANETLPLQVAKLQPMKLESVDNFDKYKSFVDHMNNLIKILNEQSDMFDIEPFNPTFEGWEKASKLITEYSPLINNYNEVVSTAKTFESAHTEDSRKKFYFASGKFAFETAIIVGAVFYTASYEAVGIAYRSVGLNTFALKCGSCVSVILSQAHWTIRTVLVEGSSQAAQFVIDTVEQMQQDGTIDRAKNSTQEALNKGKEAFDNLMTKISESG